MTIPVWRRRRERELDEEIDAHLRMATRDRIERGEQADEAAAAAGREFGNVGLVKEVTRDMWGWRWLEQFLRDVRLSFRFMARAPGVTAVLVLTLALGIGANTAIFTMVDAVLIEPLPFRDPDRLVVVWEQNDRRPGKPNVVSPANLLRWQARATAFERIAAFYDFRTNVSGAGGDPEELIGQAVSPEYFRTLGVSPRIGRAFAPGEGAGHFSGHDRETLISHELWQRRFVGDPGVVGRAIHLDGDPVTIVGVMPPDVRLFLKAGSLVGKPPDLWVQFQYPASWHTPRGRFLSAFGRLKPGVSLERAQAEMDAIARNLTAEWPDFDTGWTAQVVPMHTEIAGELRPALLVLAAAVGFVLLIACANVANLLLARGAARRREFAIRTALGAARGQVVRQLLTEALVLGLLGGAAGILVARLGTSALVALSPVDLAIGHVGLSLAVLGFTAAVSLVAVAICGFAPAFDASRSHAHDALKEGVRQAGPAPRSRRLRQAFVVSEVALAVVLLVGAGLLIRSFTTLRAVNPGFDAQSVLTMRVSLPPLAYQDGARRMRFFREAAERIAAIPGVRAAGAISFLPFTGLGAATSFTIDGRPAPPPGHSPVADVRVCDNDYFRAMRIPLVTGRLFTEREMQEKSDVVVVNAELVREYFPNEDPIGKQLRIAMNDPVVPTTIIGVVGDARYVDLATGARAMTYWPHPQLPYSAMTFAVRTDVGPPSVAAAAERAIRSLDPNQPVSDVRSMDQWIAKSLARARFSWTVLAVFGAFALLLTSIGIYGVIAYSVGQRTSEIGIRVALGALRHDVVSMVVRQGLELTAVGLAVGVLLAFPLARALGALLYGVGGADRVAFAGAVAMLGAVALVASYLPARRAARIDPVEALRQE